VCGSQSRGRGKGEGTRAGHEGEGGVTEMAHGRGHEGEDEGGRRWGCARRSRIGGRGSRGEGGGRPPYPLKSISNNASN
jgi:hypothetical protein